MSKNLSIIVSGCTQGIGLAICQYFAQKGYNVAGYARNINKLANMQHEMSMAFPNQQFYFEACDARSKIDIQTFATNAISTLQDIHLVVNNAGTFLPGNIQDEADGQLEQLIETNLYSAYYLTRALLPHLKTQTTAHIFNMCSIASVQAYPNGGSYSISKFALLGLNKQLRLELTDTNVKVTAILPGATYTPSWSNSGLPPERFIPAEDIAKLIWEVSCLSPSTNVEEILVRPIKGDI